jgi:hypothetical protein
MQESTKTLQPRELTPAEQAELEQCNLLLVQLEKQFKEIFPEEDWV